MPLCIDVVTAIAEDLTRDAGPAERVVEQIRSTLDRSQPEPLWRQVARVLRSAVASGDLPHGTLLNGEVEMAKQLGLSRPTLRRALTDLADGGYLVRRRGLGSRVLNPRLGTAAAPLTRRPAGDVRTDLLGVSDERAGGTVAEALGIMPGALVTVARRRQWLDGSPISLLTDWVPGDIAQLRRADLIRLGVAASLRKAGIRVHLEERVVGARMATLPELADLEEQLGAVVLVLDRFAYDERGGVVAYGRHLYAASRHSLRWRHLARPEPSAGLPG